MTNFVIDDHKLGIQEYAKQDLICIDQIRLKIDKDETDINYSKK